MDLITQPGYYSLVQYRPDQTRLESVNLGVALLCPAYQFIRARTVASLRRVERFFGRGSFDRESLLAGLESLRARVDHLWGEVRTAEDLLHFSQTRANEIILTAPRPIKVASPGADLDALFGELFPGQQRARAARHQRFPELDAVFQRPTLVGRVQYDQKVRVPIIGKELVVPYAYRNGVLNLVCPESLGGRPAAAMNRIERLALEGDLLQRHAGPQSDERRMIVVLNSSDVDEHAALAQQAQGLLDTYSIRTVLPAGLAVFGDEVEATTAHCD